jgi:diguanylate cyclase (GGDEF)-like protein
MACAGLSECALGAQPPLLVLAPGLPAVVDRGGRALSCGGADIEATRRTHLELPLNSEPRTADTRLQDAFAAAARILARGGELDARVQSLAAQVGEVTGATISVVYLLDAGSRALVPVAWHGLTDDEVVSLTGGTPSDARAETWANPTPGRSDGPAVRGGQDDPAVRVLHERRAELVESETGAGLAALRRGLAAVAYAPLVAEDGTGGLEVEGVLAAGVESPSADAARLLTMLGAMADLCAASVRQSRLERALGERSDWVERVAQTDALTGLANRRTFDRVLELELARAARQGTPLSVAVFDVDGLDEIARAHGAPTGDDVLRRVASAIADTVRLVDTVARYGGDEFALVAPGAAGRTVAQRVIDAVGRLEPVAGRDSISLSAGLAGFPEDGATGQELLAAADSALREAKRHGRGGLAGPGSAAADAGSRR